MATGGRWSALAAMMIVSSISAAPRGVGAQAREREVLLRLHPQMGDTLHSQLDQQMEVTATLRSPAGAQTSKSVTTSVALYSRTIVQGSSPANTLVLTLVDSAELHTSDVHSAEQVAQAERTLRRQQLLLELAPDGTVQSARDLHGGATPHGLADAISMMPAVFPRRPVSVGDVWTREMPLPSAGALGVHGAGHVNATFRLDSLDRDGNLAYVSMRGDILTDRDSQGVLLSGAVTGAMLVDRVRGWMTDSRFTVLLRSVVTPPAATGLAPMRFVTRLTQRLRTMDKR